MRRRRYPYGAAGKRIVICEIHSNPFIRYLLYILHNLLSKKRTNLDST